MSERDRLVGVHEEHGEGHVEVELEGLQVHAVHLDHPHADELVHQLADFGIATDNLPVKFGAAVSRDASEDDHERLARSTRLGAGLLEVVVDPLLDLLHVGLVLVDHLVAGKLILRCLGGGCGAERKGD
jgi:hypothetical protein